MKSSEYWQRRMNNIEQSRFESAFKAYKASEKALTAAQRQLDQQIEVWVNRIAVNNEVSYAEARKLLKGAELDEFKWDVQQYITAGKENAVDQRWMKQLENASARAHISRLEAMKVELQQQVETAYGVQQSATADLLTKVYEDSYYHTAYEVQKGVGVGWEVGGVNEKSLNRTVNGWATDEKSFSDRIWSNRTQMVNELQQQLTVQIATGAAPDKAIEALQKYVDKDIKSAKSKAGTLVMTESAAIGNAAQMDAYKELGVEEYEIVETLDSLTCSTCGDWDGKHFPIEEFQIGATAPPFHPNCRGCTAPWFDDDEEAGLVGERVARNGDGSRYYVPGDMNYAEWKEKFVNGGDKSDLDVVITDGTNTWKRTADQKIAGVKRGEAMTFEAADTYTVNPKYGTSEGYSINCQSCVPTFEARQRGYNVRVKPNTKGSACEQLSKQTNLVWIDPATGSHPSYILSEAATTPTKMLSFLESTVQSGQRYSIQFGWKGRSRYGHIVNLDLTTEGMLRIKDNQRGKGERSEWVGSKEVLAYLKRIKYTTSIYGHKVYAGPKLLRIDNMDFDLSIANEIMEAAE